MRIIHFADLHLGVENYGRLDAATGLNTRFLDFLAALDRLVDYAISSDTDLVLFCGDAYKSREPSQTQQREFARRIRHLSQKGIPVFILIGNHDLPNAIGRATSTEIFDTLAVDNVHVSNKPEIYNLHTKNGTVQIASLPWLRRSALLSRDEVKSLTTEQLKQRMEEVLTGIVNDFAVKLDPSLPSILAAHVWISGSQLGSERSMSLGIEHGLLLSTVANPIFDYVALGHIHKQQVLAINPPVVYSGSVERIDFGEEADDKGFYEIEIQTDAEGKKHVAYNFRKIEGRRFITIDFEVKPEDLNPTAGILQAIAAQPVKDTIVRLHIKLPAEGGGLINDNEIRNALNPAHNFTIAREMVRENRLRLGKFTAEELTPLEALKQYMIAKNISPERAKILLEYGEKLIAEQNEKT